MKGDGGWECCHGVAVNREGCDCSISLAVMWFETSGAAVEVC